ncbi:MAG: hypothetical protein ACRDTE_26545 [Pseudonocardiaceae bacterium]
MTYVGRRLPRIEGRAKVTGAEKYAADVVLPEMLWGRTLRSPHPHAIPHAIPDGVPNAQSYVSWRQGDIEKGFAESDIVVENEFRRRRSTRGTSSLRRRRSTSTETGGCTCG